MMRNKNIDMLTSDNMYYDKEDLEGNLELIRSELQKYINDYTVNNATKLYNYIFNISDEELKNIVENIDIVIRQDNYYIDYINTLENILYIIDEKVTA